MPMQPKAAARAGRLVNKLLAVGHQKRDHQSHAQQKHLGGIELDRESLRNKAVEAGQALEHGESMRHGVTAEEHPGEGYGKESERPCSRRGYVKRCAAIGDSAPERAPHMGDHQVCSVKQSPQDKGPCCAVPQAAEQHRDDEIGVPPSLAMTIAAERYVEVVAQPVGQRNMRASPTAMSE